jgi:sodium/potassium-transporting ATPase subunit alpha
VAFGTSYQLLPLYWLIPMAFGSFVLLYVTARFYILKKLMPMTWGPEIEGLQMYPTKWSTGR